MKSQTYDIKLDDFSFKKYSWFMFQVLVIFRAN